MEECIAAARRERARRLVRLKVMKAEYFREPAWNILLELYILSAEGRGPVMTKQIFPAALVPYATANRYLDTLEADGEIHREKTELDRRQRLVSLTLQGRETIETALSAMIEADERYIAPHRFTRAGEPLPDRSFQWAGTER